MLTTWATYQAAFGSNHQPWFIARRRMSQRIVTSHGRGILHNPPHTVVDGLALLDGRYAAMLAKIVRMPPPVQLTDEDLEIAQEACRANAARCRRQGAIEEAAMWLRV